MIWRKVFEWENEENSKRNDKLELYDKYIYYMQEAIKNFEESKPEDWINILTEIKDYLKDLEEGLEEL